MAAVLLPPTFHNSFWSNQDYFRTGLEVLMRKLREGCEESVEIGVFIKTQAQHYRQLSRSIINDTPSLPLIFSPDSTDSPSTLQNTLSTIHSSAVTAQADHYARLADELEFRVAREFERWSAAHRNRVMMAAEEALGNGTTNKGHPEDRGLVGQYEALGLDVAKLKQSYLSKARLADDLEEDARFAPHFNPPATPKAPTKNLTPALPSSPRLASLRERSHQSSTSLDGSSSNNSNLRRTGTVAERINEKLRAATTLRRTPGTGSTGGSISSLKGMGESIVTMSLADSKAIDTPTSGLPPINNGESAGDHILLAGLSMPIMKLFELLAQLQHYLATTLPSEQPDAKVDERRPSAPATETNGSTDADHAKSSGIDSNPAGDGGLRSRTRMTVLGSYDCCVSGEELREWLLGHVEGFGSDPARGSEAGAALVKWGLIGRIGVGRGWQDDEETFYYLKDAAFDTSPFAIESLKNHIRAAEPTSKSASTANTASAPATTALPSLSTASTLVKSYLPALASLPGALTGSADPGLEAPHIRARKEAKIADEEYRTGVDDLERMRLRVEEWVEKGLKSWERWERERMGSVKTVLGQYHQVISTLPGRMQAWTSDVKMAVDVFKPDVDFRAMIENNRIGNFRPTPHVYESLDSDEPEVSFGIDLRKWAGSNWKAILHNNGNEKDGSGKGNVPGAFMALLKGLEVKYSEVSDDLRRKSWIFLVDLRETHELRERLNDPRVPLSDMLDEVAKFNAPVIAATIKLWLLELNPPLCGYDAYEACRSIYGKRSDERSSEKIATALSEIMGRLSGVQILILDTLFTHLHELIENTKTEEADDVYITKLSLSLGRAILRPPTESAVTLQDRTPSRLFIDLYTHRTEIFSPLVERAQRAIDRPMPVRKRTRPVDQRISRSRLSESGEDGVSLYRNMQTSAPAPASAAAAGEISEQRDGASAREAPRLNGDDQDRSDAAPVEQETSPTDDVLEDYTQPEVEPPVLRESVPSPPVDALPVLETTSAPPAARPATPPPSSRRSMDEDTPLTPVASTGARLSRARPMSGGHRDRFDENSVLAEVGETSLKRAGSGEARTVRGPRGARGPRPGPGSKLGSVDLTASPGARPGSPSIKDRIAHLEGRAGAGAGTTDRFV
ncbi:hypothetical protein NliqN6_2753 [Naganishia liquefaciens]|uniref:Rho-GAP domain-containing protein n=1 Tax=Naganishia liquefaciens TaxID=104408 RepID=A0A8H3YG38_9TREE|nr:hypothetical protein NliqN6_2753 [Naganishia liquefaciens]